MKKLSSFIIVFLLLSTAVVSSTYSAEGFKLSRSSFVEKGYNDSILTIDQYGYYSIITKSKHGTGLRLINKMTGPGSLVGNPGSKDGRLDMLLDEGQYKIQLFSQQKTEGKLSLEVRKYTELNSPQAPVLIQDQQIETELQDLQQLSWWIEIKKDNQDVRLEMQGRNLSQLVIWKDGSWLENVKIYKKTVEIEVGRPMTSILVNTRLKKGYYKVTAYGGVPHKWAKQSTAHPFRLHYGLESISPNSRFTGEISKFGVNRYLIQGNVDFFLLQANEKKPYKLKVNRLSQGENFSQYDYIANITKKSRTPQCFIKRSFNNRTVVVSVEGTPGDPFTLQTLYSSRAMYVRPPQSGKYWVSTIHSGFIGDNVDASGFLVDTYGTDSVVARDMPVLSKKQGWTRRFNLLKTVSVYFHVQQAGNYEIDYSGTKARTKIERFLTSYPRDYRSPSYETGKRVVSLEKGIYVLYLQPDKKGIINFQIKPKGLSLGKKKESPFQGNVQIPSIKLNRSHSYRFYTGQQGEVRTGVQLRALPLDLRQALSVYLKAGQSLEIPVSVFSKSVVVIRSETGSPYELSQSSQILDSGKSVLDKGTHTLTLKNKGKKTEMFSIQLRDVDTLPAAEPRYLSTKVLDSFPEFETIVADKTRYFDLGSTDRKVFLLKVDKAGIYKIQSTGLLKTKATLRDRLIPYMDSAQVNGLGRNFLMQSFLKEGIYQVKVETLGRSAGHLGVLLSYIPPIEGGELVLEKTMKATVQAGDSLIYKFRIPQQDFFQVRTIGMNREYGCRLEDSDGYPLYQPGKNTDFNVEFRKGDYRLISLPQEVEGKRLTTFSKKIDKKKVTGKGPITLELNSSHNNVWKESEGKLRQPDVYHFTLPATMPVKISFSSTMRAQLYRVSGTKRKLISKIYPDDAQSHELEVGDYSLEFYALRKDNFVDYQVNLRTSVLVNGLSYTFNPRRTYDVIVERDSLVEFSSTGKLDVSAELYNEQGDLLEVVDDSLNDWNFMFSRYLKAGSYRLLINKKSGYGKTTVAMNILKSAHRQALGLSQDRQIDMDKRKNIFPLKINSGYYHLSIDANSQLALALQQQSGSVWKDKAVIKGQDFDWYFYLPVDNKYALALWSLDHIDENITLGLSRFKPQSVSLSALKKGLDVTPAGDNISLAVSIPQGSSYRIECVDAASGKKVAPISYATVTGKTLMWTTVRNDFISSAKGTLMINLRYSKAVRLTLTEIRLKPGQPLGLSLNGGEKAFVRLPQQHKGLSLVMAKGSMGQPLTSFLSSGSPIKMSDGTVVSEDFSFHHASALSVSLSSQPGSVLVWNPLRNIAEAGITLHYYEIKKSRALSLQDRAESVLAKERSQSYKSSTASHFEVALDAGMVAFSWNEKGIQEIHYSYESKALFQFRKKATRITIINLDSPKGRYLVEVINDLKTYRKGSLLVENTFSRKGYQEQDFNALKNYKRLYISPNLRISLLDAQGMMRQSVRGKSLPLKAGYYRYVMEYQAEYSKAWMGGDSLKDRWGLKKPSGVIRLSAPSYVDIGEIQWYKIKTAEPSVVQLSSQNDFVAALVVDGRFSELREVKGPDSTALFIPKGIVLIGLRAPNRVDRGGGSVYIHWRKVEPLQSSLGRTLLLTDNSSRAFSFTLAEKQEVALGYNAPSDLIDCQLFDSKGEMIADGPVIFTELDAGAYTVIYKLREELDFSEFSPIYVDTRTIEEQILSDKVRAFLVKYGYIKGNN